MNQRHRLIVQFNRKLTAVVGTFQTRTRDQAAAAAGPKAELLLNYISSVYVHNCGTIPYGTMYPATQSADDLVITAQGWSRYKGH